MNRAATLRAFLAMVLVVGTGVIGIGATRAGAVTMTFWEGIDHAITYYGDRVPEVSVTMGCPALEAAEASALTTLGEVLTMRADLVKLQGDLTEQLNTRNAQLSKNIAGIAGALDRLAGIVLNQDTVQAYHDIIADLHADLGLVGRYITLLQTLDTRIEGVLSQIDNEMSQKCRPTPLTAVFTQALYHTVYTEHVVDERWSYYWTVSIPADPRCATGFTHNHPFLWTATWYHADTDIGGPCVHANGGYSSGAGHPGIVKLIVTSSRFVCTLTYHGTLTGTGAVPECVSTKKAGT
jgi:hypothetical protein